MEGKKEKKKSEFSATFKTGAISLAFLIIGYQAALFVHKAAVTSIAAHRDSPDTVFVVDEALARRLLDQELSVNGANADFSNLQSATMPGRPVESERARTAGQESSGHGKLAVTVRKDAPHSDVAAEAYSRKPGRKIESFSFNPNTVSETELVRLGFSARQAASILHYREKGGRFRRKSDFARSFVVSDSVFTRLEPYIDIPLTDINSADSAAFDALPGIGPYFAAKMVSYRKELGGYSCKEQLMEIYRFDEEKYRALEDLICCSQRQPFPFWSADAETLAAHPHVRSVRTAAAIILYRENNPREAWTVGGLLGAGILSAAQAEKLSRCRLE